MTSKLTSEILDDETLAELIAFRRSRVEYCQKEGLPYQKALHDSMMLALEELQELRKTDSEPVAVIDKEGNPMTRDECNDDRIFAICCKVGTPLYTHPAPSIPATGYDNIKAIESAISALKTTIKDAKRFRYCLGALMNLDDEVAKLKASASVSAPSIPSAVTWCPKCNDTGLADSGGVQPWGEPILIECDCRTEPAPVVNYVPLGDSPYDVPHSMPSNLRELIAEEIGILFSDDDAQSVWDVCRRAAMLAASPQLPGSESATVPGKWIPVSERVPTKQDGSVFLTWNGQYIGKELFLMGSFQCLKPEIITHWMPLPAPPTEVKGE